MSSTLAQLSGAFFPRHLRGRYFGEPVFPLGSSDLVARALASAGLAGLIALPFLMVASFAVEAPLAGPAVIALGYLASAHAATGGDMQRANAWLLAVFLGFIAWSFFILQIGGATTWPPLAAALLAPLLASAPALARRLIQTKSSAAAQAVARERVACLEQFAPSEAVLFVDRDGGMLTATRAGCLRLGLPANASASAFMQKLHMLDRPHLLDALARGGAVEGAEVLLRLLGRTPGQSGFVSAKLTPGPLQTVAIKLGDASSAAPPSVEMASAGEIGVAETLQKDAEARPAAAVNIREAVDFALNQLGSTVDTSGVRLDVPGDIAVACDRRALRRICATLVATAGAVRSGSLIVAARRMRHAVLLRISIEAEDDEPDVAALRQALGRTGVGEMIDREGGSMIVEACENGMRVSVRLVTAQPARSVGDS